jgi:hypothetical protein
MIAQKKQLQNAPSAGEKPPLVPTCSLTDFGTLAFGQYTMKGW